MRALGGTVTPMSDSETTAIVLAAGKGTRMKSARAKVLHPVGGRPMLFYLLDTLDALGVARRVLVVGAEREQVAAAVEGCDIPLAVQEPQLGTGHAVMAAGEALDEFIGDILVLYGDTPFITAATLERLLAAKRASGVSGERPGLAVLGFRPADPGAYGRLVLDKDGHLERIVEAKDAGESERAIGLCNSGVMAVEGSLLSEALAQISNDNAKGEYYLTDIVAIARTMGRSAAVAEAGEEELLGVNSRADLATAEAVFQSVARSRAMENGATLVAPESVFFSHDTLLGQDVTVEPHVVFGPGVQVADGAVIRAFSHLEGASVHSGAEIGPYARLRPGTTVGEAAKVGNFVEVKKASLAPGAKANHLAYLGDAQVGANANIGAGTITCNYDGFSKHRTEIGAGAFIGSNSALVAPVTIGEGAIVGAGSAIAEDVPADALGLTRAEQTTKDGWAKRFRERQGKKTSGETTSGKTAKTEDQ